MKHKFLHSDNVNEIEHNSEGLTVTFKNGGRYRYPAPESHFHGMRAAQSPGSYLRANVINAKDGDGKPLYPHVKL